MYWDKEFGGKNRRYYDILLSLSAVLVVIALITGNAVLFLIIGTTIAFVSLSKLYDKQIGEKLTLENPKRTYRMFPDEEVEVDIMVKNHSRYPVINGAFQFSVGNEVKGTSYFYMNKKSMARYSIPLSVFHKGDVRAPITFKAQKRGTTRIHTISYAFPHLLNFDSVMLFYRSFCKTEFVVYPKPLPVNGLKEKFYLTLGNQTTLYSPFEDRLSPMGTRDYISSDSFDRIHWKASAKKQSLQTKVYERNQDITWSFVINITSVTKLGNAHITEHMENLLSYVTYMCQYAVKLGYAFEIHLNARTTGASYFHLYEGEGKEHLRSALDLLARVKTDETYMPFEQMLHIINHDMYRPKTIFIIGDITPGAELYTSKWQRKKMGIMQVIDQDGVGVLRDVNKEVAL